MPPSGNNVRASCGWVRPNRKYVWSSRFIHGPAQLPPPRRVIEADARVMPGGHPIRANSGGPLQEFIEFEEIVAQRAGNRRAPGQIFVHERPHHLLLEAPLEIHHVIGDPQQLRRVPRVVHVFEGAAAAGDAALRAISSGKRL